MTLPSLKYIVVDQPHQVRQEMLVYLSEILKKGGWKSVHTFEIFYSRDIINSEDVDFEFNYVSSVLDIKCFENEIIFLNLIVI